LIVATALEVEYELRCVTIALARAKLSIEAAHVVELVLQHALRNSAARTHPSLQITSAGCHASQQPEVWGQEMAYLLSQHWEPRFWIGPTSGSLT
jgi:hypothetical protein